MYDYMIGDVVNLKDLMMELNDNHCTMVGVIYTSDSNQVIIFYEKPEEKQTIGFLRPDEG